MQFWPSTRQGRSRLDQVLLGCLSWFKFAFSSCHRFVLVLQEWFGDNVGQIRINLPTKNLGKNLDITHGVLRYHT